jgi:hypothetical protein
MPTGSGARDSLALASLGSSLASSSTSTPLDLKPRALAQLGLKLLALDLLGLRHLALAPLGLKSKGARARVINAYGRWG